MTDYSILYHTACFDQFKHGSSTRTERIGAPDAAEFALVMAKSQDGGIGFDQCAASGNLLKALISHCFHFNVQNALCPPPKTPPAYLPRMLFRDKNGRFKALHDEHMKFKQELKKHAILSRRRESKPPSQPLLSAFLDDPQTEINSQVYELLAHSCHYVCMAKLAGEYGHGAFDVFSNDLEFFFTELAILAGPHTAIIPVEHPSALPMN